MLKRMMLVWMCLLLVPGLSMADGNFFAQGTYAAVDNPDPADLLNLREHPDADASAIGKYYNGTLVRLVAEYETSPEWVEVEIGHAYGSACGFMMKKYLSDCTQKQVPGAHPSRLLQQPAQLLSRPDPSGKVMAVLPAGTLCIVLGHARAYEHVQVNGCVGYLLP